MDSCTLTAWIGQHSPADTDAETVGVKRVMVDAGQYVA